MQWTTEVGPMVSREQFELVGSWWTTRWPGATLHCGGPAEVDGHGEADFFAPAVLTGVTDDMRIMREEIFGPVVPIVTVGLRGGGDRAGERLRVRPGRVGVDHGPRPRRSHARRLEAGMVWVNDHMYSTARARARGAA